MIGRTLSHYKVLEELSRGGMGIVYRALDVKLDREVALKVLPPELVADPERKRRFIQEAKAAAKLNHPHIGMVFEIDEADDVTFIAMELIRGEQLKNIINREKLPLARSLELATEIAEGLACAHDKGIVHRDLKPANAMVTEDGHAKIIDFGLAKLVEPLAGEGSDVETAIRGETDPGKVLGTVSYMSPEQAGGKKVDHRSDIFTFGVLLHEMLTGSQPFQGPTGIDTLHAILNKPAPPLSALPQSSSATLYELQRLVHRCLAKDPEDRYQTAKDMLSELRRVRRESDSDVSTIVSEVPVYPRPPSKKWHLGWITVVLMLLAGVVAYFLLSKKETILQLTNPVQVTASTGVEDHPTWSPDGRTLAYHQSGDVWVSQVGSGQPLNRTAESTSWDNFPSWSPDGSQIAFISNKDGTSEISVMPVLSGAPHKVANCAYGFGPPQWSRDGARLAYVVIEGEERFLEIISFQTGETQRVMLPGKSERRYDLSWSPDERYVAYVDAGSRLREITRLLVLSIADGDNFEVTDGKTNVWSPNWSLDGRSLYFVSNRGESMDLWQQAMEDGKPSGDPQPVSAGLVVRSAAFSPDETKLAYSKGRRVANLWRVPILADRRATWADAVQLTFDQALIEFVDASPDGRQLMFSSDRSGNQDLWMMSVEGGEMRQVTTDPTPDWCPAWSPDGRTIAFHSHRSGNRDIWTMSATGGPAHQVTRYEGQDLYATWSPDGRELAFDSNRNGSRDIWVIPAEGGTARPVTNQTSSERMPGWSPDGKWFYFTSNQTGRYLLCRVPSAGAAFERASNEFGQWPKWSPDGKALYFIGWGDGLYHLWELSVEDDTVRPVTDLVGKLGQIGPSALATDGSYLYFTWVEDLGDLWVMDVVRE